MAETLVNDKPLLNDEPKRNNKPISNDLFLETLALKESKEQESKKRANVLHVLEGACMEMDAVNRNNRIYPKELVIKKILNNEPTNDLIRKNCLFGEGCHPETRLETIVPNICMSVEKLWIPDSDPSKLYGRFAILDTPTGRIVSTLLEYGAKIGVSARASGTSTFTPEGYELLNVDDYEFYTFDVVTEPGFACARPNLVEGKSSKSIINEYKSCSENELECVKTMMEQYPAFFKTELSAVNSIMSHGDKKQRKTTTNEPKNNSNESLTTENNSLKKQISRFKAENKKLRSLNKKRHVEEQTEIANLKKQVEQLQYHFEECTSANKALETKNKALSSIVESQKQVIKNKNEQNKKYLKECLSKKIKSVHDKNDYESNVKFISKKTNVNESAVKKVYKSIDDNVNQAITSIKILSPYLNETRTPVKILNIKESKSITQELSEKTNKQEQTIDTTRFLESLF
jgi:hypothetical protein